MEDDETQCEGCGCVGDVLLHWDQWLCDDCADAVLDMHFAEDYEE